jgi:hypothetical protein
MWSFQFPQLQINSARNYASSVLLKGAISLQGNSAEGIEKIHQVLAKSWFGACRLYAVLFTLQIR